MKLKKSDISTRKASEIQEERISKKLNAIRTPNSGAGKWKKGDLYIPDASLLIEAKTCIKEKDSFSIKKEWLEKTIEESFSNRLDNSILAFSFCYDDKKDYYVINDSLMSFLVEKLIEENKNI